MIPVLCINVDAMSTRQPLFPLGQEGRRSFQGGLPGGQTTRSGFGQARGLPVPAKPDQHAPRRPVAVAPRLVIAPTAGPQPSSRVKALINKNNNVTKVTK